jgi:hypothetical protein
MKIFASVCGLVVLIFLTGCKSNSTAPNSTVVLPGIGTTYIYDNISYDSNGVITGRDTETMRIVKTNITHAGYNDVAAFSDTYSDNPTSIGTLYFRFLPNGDLAFEALSAYVNSSNGPYGWLTLPFSNHSLQSLSYDTAYFSGGREEYDTISFAAHFTVTQTLQVQGKILSFDKIAVVTHEGSAAQGAQLSTNNSIGSIMYSPSLGVIGGTGDDSNFRDGTNQGTDVSTLISYPLK